MTLRLRLSDDGSVHEGSSDPRSPRAPSSTPTDGEIVAHSRNPLSVREYGELIMSERATQDPAYRRELDARLAAGHYWGKMGEALSTPQDVAGQIVQADRSIPLAIAQRAVQAGGFATHEERQNAYNDARYKTSDDFRAMTAARDALTEL